MEKRFTLIAVVFFAITGLVHAQNECIVKITHGMNKSLPPSYTFITDFQDSTAKYYWHFSDGTRYEEPTPTHTFKITGNYVVEVKVVDAKGKVCYGRIAGQFEGRESPSTDPALIYAKGWVRDLSTIAGCGLVISTDDGKVLLPVEILPKFEIKEGQRIEFAYEFLQNVATICMAGRTIKIRRIGEIPSNQPVLIEASGKVIDFSKVEGCGLVIALSNDKVLVPVEIIPDFELKEGQIVKFVYEPLAILGGVCVVGPLVKIHRIVEIPDSTPVLYASGKVTDFSAVEGCGLAVELADGSKLVLVEILPEIALKEGMYIEFAYEILNNANTKCMAGKNIRILRLKVIGNDPVIHYGKGVVKDLSSLAGCGLSVVLDNGRTLIPVEFVNDIELKEGQYVELAFEVLTDRSSICMAGTLVKVHKIAEISITQPILMTGTGKVKDMSSVAGCRYVIILDSGKTVMPGEIIPDFSLRDGQYVYLEYENIAEAFSICNMGPLVRIRRIIDKGFSEGCYIETAYKQTDTSKMQYRFYARVNDQVETWLWDFGDGETSTEAEPVHSYRKAGVYTVICTVVTVKGCKTTRRMFLVVMAPGLPLCEGAVNLQLFDPSPGKCDGKAIATLLDKDGNQYKDVIYRWSIGETGNTVSNLCADKPYQLYALIEGICQKNTSFTFLSKPMWRASNTDSKFTFHVENPLYGVTYIWDFGNGLTAFGTTVTHDFGNDGDYSIRLIASYGADSNESEQIIRVHNTVTSVSVAETPAFRIYPNPASGRIWVEAGNTISGMALATISDFGGRVILQQNLYYSGLSRNEINIQYITPGVYIIRISDGTGILTQKLLVK